MISTTQFFTSTDYLLSLPVIMLTLFALGVLLVDLLLPAEWKVINAWTAFGGLAFSAAALFKVQTAYRIAEASGRVPVQAASWARG